MTTTDHGLSPDDLRARYAAEADKRRRAEGVRQYLELKNTEFDRDPYVEPGFTRDAVVEETDVVIVGAGWAGMTTAAYLTDEGVTSYRILDKAGDFGGTWYWNRYPGCMCDVESYCYLPLLERTGYMPTKKYAHAQEIFEYAQLLGRTFDMYPHALFQTEVTGMVWNDATDRWDVTTTRGDRLAARFVVICGGVLHKAKLPGIPGIEDFRGHGFHTSRWDYEYTGGGPEEPMDRLADKTVAIIGTGATAVQAVPKLAAAAKHLYVFQRTPSTVSERNQRDTDPEWFAEISSRPGWHDERMENFIACTTGGNPAVDLVDDGWTEMFAVDTKKTPRDEAEAAELELLDFQQMERVRQRIRDIVRDRVTAEKLLPWYKMSCKRPCFHDDYLPTFNRDNVTLVDTDGRGVDRITETGVVVGDTEYPVDCIVYASGFELSTFYTHRLGFDPVGRDGASMSEVWAQGAYTLQGVFAHDFPNLCMNSAIQGGQHINIAYASTKIAEHTAAVIARCLAEGVVIEPTIEAEDEWYQVILSTVMAYGAYFASCTPSYLNNEGQPPDESGGRAGAFMNSAVEFKDLLRAWRDEGSMAGLVRTPYAS